MQVLADDQHGLLPCHGLELVEKGGECLPPLLHGTEHERRIALAGRDRKQRGNQRRCGRDLLRAARQHGLELVEFLFGQVLRPDAGGALELGDEGMQRAVGVIGRALIPHPAVRLRCKAFADPCHQARLADPGLAGNQHHLALPFPRQPLARQRECDLRLAPDKADRTRGAHRLEAAFRYGPALDRPHRDRLADTLDLAAAEAAERKEIAKQCARRRRNDDRAGLREALQPGSDVRRVSDRCLLLRRIAADEVADHHEPGRNRDSYLDPLPRAQRPHCGDDVEARAHGALRVVLMRAGIAEIGEDAVADEPGDHAVVGRDDLRTSDPIDTDHLPHVFRIEPRRERGRADQVAEHDGEVTPLGVGPARGLGDQSALIEFGDHAQHLAAMPEQDTK